MNEASVLTRIRRTDRREGKQYNDSEAEGKKIYRESSVSYVGLRLCVSLMFLLDVAANDQRRPRSTTMGELLDQPSSQ